MSEPAGHSHFRTLANAVEHGNIGHLRGENNLVTENRLNEEVATTIAERESHKFVHVSFGVFLTKS
jgi:hypothetical protein